MRNLKTNKASETEELSKKRQDHTQKIHGKKENKKSTRGKEKVVRNRRPQETAPGHS